MIKNDYEGILEMKNIQKRTKYVLNHKFNYEDNNKYFKNSNLNNEAELSNRKYKVTNKNDIVSQNSKSYKFRDYLSDTNNNENFNNRANYILNEDQNYTNESNLNK